jgi:heme exporter protein C
MDRQPGWLNILDVVTVIFFLAALAMVFFFTPVEEVMGAVQKVFYFHVASAWAGMIGFLAAAVFAVILLIRRNMRFDTLSAAAVEVGLVFMVISIVSGSIWARPIWNTWWTWDPRLTTSVVMVLLYVAYLMLRSSLDDPSRRARFSAVFAVVSTVSVPLTFLSIRLFRTIHPVLIANGNSAVGAFSMSPAMQQTFFFSLGVFTVLFSDLLIHRYYLGRLTEERAQESEKAKQES